MVDLQHSRPSVRRQGSRPFFKWVGGKRDLLAKHGHLFPDPSTVRGYREPFLGGGAMFFGRYAGGPPALLGDKNQRLVAIYRAVQQYPLELLEELQRHPYSREHFEDVKLALNLRPDASIVKIAAWMLVILAYGFNGLYRENGSGECNTAFGKTSSGAAPTLPSREAILTGSALLQGVRLGHGDFEGCLEYLQRDELIYLDPPYEPVSATSSFTDYVADGFSFGRQSPAGQGGFEVLACDTSPEAIDIARARLRFWQSQSPGKTAKVLRRGVKAAPAQRSLLDV